MNKRLLGLQAVKAHNDLGYKNLLGLFKKDKKNKHDYFAVYNTI